jgi:SAM-dependent methyltransferase
MCDSKNLELALPMKPSPIGDAFVPAAKLGISQPLYPLDLYLCLDCGHVQNIDVVNPEALFRDYLYTTSSSAGLVQHFRAYAADVSRRLDLPRNSFVMDIGSNDGSLLKFFKSAGMQVLGVDPACVARKAIEEGVPTINDFFTSSLAPGIRREHGPAALVTANNVFAHSDNLGDMLDGIREVLSNDGVFVFEVSYLPDIVDRFVFDTIYHEHVSYHSIEPLAAFFERHGLELFDVQRIGTKGGSIRGFAQMKSHGKRTVAPIVLQLITEERDRGFSKLAIYTEYAAQIERRKVAIADFVDAALKDGKMVAAYGASTTTTTLMWHFELERKLTFIADDNPTKYGLYAPACHIPVVPSDELYVRKPDVVVVLAWQYADPIVKRHHRFIDDGGTFVVPLPDLQVRRHAAS